MKVFTNHDPEVCKDGRQDRLIALWRDSWMNQGWDPVVVDASFAKRHPFYQVITESDFLQKTVNDWPYMRAVYCKWMNMELIGGGFYSDPDVINYDANQGHLPRHDRGYVYVSQCMPSLLFGNAEFYARVTRTIRNVAVLRQCGKICTQDDLNDMNIFRDYWKGEVFEDPACKNYGEEEWEVARLVHYHMSTTGQVDRAELIRKVRPL